MHLQMDSVALKIEGFFSLLIAASGGGEKIAYFCLGVHFFLKLFNSAGVRNVHLHCGNDQAAKSAWRQGVTKVHLPSVAPCSTLWHGEGCSPCFCSRVLTSQDNAEFGTAHGDLSGKPLGSWSSLAMLFCHKRCRNMLFPNRISHQISPQHRISHQSLPWHRPPVQHHSTQLGSFCQEKQQQSVKHGCRVWRCNPPAPIPLPTERAAGQHLSLWKWSSALIQRFCCLSYFCTSN